MDIDLSQYSFDTIALNVVVAWLIQKMKLSQWTVFSWINDNTPRINVAVSVAMAALTAAGMSVNWEAVGASHTLTISGITLTSTVLFVWYVVKNVAFQHGAYKVMFQNQRELTLEEAAKLLGSSGRERLSETAMTVPLEAKK